MPSQDIIVIGAGIFGVTAAMELRKRGYSVSLIDPGPLPHPLAASTDISKVVRMEYGPDEEYMSLMEEARAGWLHWNDAWHAEGEEALYHETGVLLVCQQPMTAGGFEYESWENLQRRGHHPERLNATTLEERFHVWNTGKYVDGFFHAHGGYAESGRVVAELVDHAAREGVVVLEGCTVETLIELGGRVEGVMLRGGKSLRADHVVIAAGAWTAKLLNMPESTIQATGHPVFHLKPLHPSRFLADVFPTFMADVAQTGYYGFPLNQDGVVKVAHHGLGTKLDPDADRMVTEADHQRLRTFLKVTFPELADAEVVYTRLCLYADTQDEDFWIARDPQREGLTLTSGGSGHGFKFGPVLGTLAADAVEGKTNPWTHKFQWREDLRLQQGREAARCHLL